MKNIALYKTGFAFLLILLFCLCGLETFAQLPPGPPGNGEPPLTAPINGLIALSLVVGTYFGVKRLRGGKKE